MSNAAIATRGAATPSPAKWERVAAQRLDEGSLPPHLPNSLKLDVVKVNIPRIIHDCNLHAVAKFYLNLCIKFSVALVLLVILQYQTSVSSAGMVTESVYPTYIDSSGHIVAFRYPAELTEPTNIQGVSNAVSVSGTAAVDRRGWVWTWNAGLDAARPVHEESESAPVKFSKARRVGKLNDAQEVTSTAWATLIRLADGTVWGIGHTKFGVLDGIPPNPASRLLDSPDRIIQPSSPVHVPLPEPVIDISTNGLNALALGQSGAIYAWGLNRFGVLGIASEKFKSVGVNRITAIADVAHVFSGHFHSYAVTKTGRVFVWGGCPQLNDDSALSPFEIKDIYDVKTLLIPYFDEYYPVFFLRYDGSVSYRSINSVWYNSGDKCRLRGGSAENMPERFSPVPVIKKKNIYQIADTYMGPDLRIIGLDDNGKFFSMFANNEP